MNLGKGICLLFVSSILLSGCDNSCKNVNSQNDFSTSDYSKFPIFNKLSYKDTLIVAYKDINGSIINMYYSKGEELKGYNTSKTLVSYKYSLFPKGDCERESYIKQSSYLSKRLDSTGYLEITLYKCTTIENAPDPCPDTLQFYTPSRFLSDTVINGKSYINVRIISNQNIYALLNLDDGVFYFELTKSGKKYWKVP